MKNEIKKIKEKELRKAISRILCSTGITPNMKGFAYLKEAIIMVYCDPEGLNTMTKVIYPDIAKMYNTSPFAVERCIRIAIEKAWRKGRSNEFYEKIGFQWLNQRPTNSEYIFIVVEILNNL